MTETFAARTPMEGLGEGGGFEATPTQDTSGGSTIPTADSSGLTNATELPDAGLFDDFAAGNSLGVIALAAFGLLGVIAFARRLRDDDEG